VYSETVAELRCGFLCISEPTLNGLHLSTFVRLFMLRPALLEAVRRAEEDRASARPSTLLPLAPDCTASNGVTSAFRDSARELGNLRETALPRAHSRRICVRAKIGVVEMSAGRIKQELPYVVKGSSKSVLVDGT
jgi:hypothetical protein